ncbi:hypothetical protein TeGR_g3595, partial [Tetraparma gracilis]
MDPSSAVGSCLHCGAAASPSPPNVQVSCDSCRSFVCTACHWCHEFAASHEVRVCDRCDAFFCGGCDEMDQCDDCSEVVCGSCSTLMSCKFCGCGLCEDCATACGRCGIVLCARDAKFAVECDTCRMAYCLVCLASGSKDPCVRCGHRPSKRVEQLVHLRLKSIYKAFKSAGPTQQRAGDARAAAAALASAAGMQQQEFGGERGAEYDVGSVLAAAEKAAIADDGLGAGGLLNPGMLQRGRTEEEAKAAEMSLLDMLDKEDDAKNKAAKKKKKKSKKKEESQGTKRAQQALEEEAAALPVPSKPPTLALQEKLHTRLLQPQPSPPP